MQMVLMEDSGEKLQVTDRDPEGLSNIVESSHILEASHVKEVSDGTQTHSLKHRRQRKVRNLVIYKSGLRKHCVIITESAALA